MDDIDFVFNELENPITYLNKLKANSYLEKEERTYSLHELLSTPVCFLFIYFFIYFFIIETKKN